MNDQSMQLRVVDLYTRYAETLCDLEISKWPDYFTDDCLYRIVSRPNHDRGHRIGPMFAESKGAWQTASQPSGRRRLFRPQPDPYCERRARREQ